MKKTMMIFLLISFAFLTGCSMHDGKGWEHTGDSTTNTDSPSEPYLLKHEH